MSNANDDKAINVSEEIRAYEDAFRRRTGFTVTNDVHLNLLKEYLLLLNQDFINHPASMRNRERILQFDEYLREDMNTHSQNFRNAHVSIYKATQRVKEKSSVTNVRRIFTERRKEMLKLTGDKYIAARSWFRCKIYPEKHALDPENIEEGEHYFTVAQKGSQLTESDVLSKHSEKFYFHEVVEYRIGKTFVYWRSKSGKR